MKLHSGLVTLIALAALIAGCAGHRPTTFLHPEYDFSQIERVAVVPFENLSSEQGTSAYMTRVFMTELLATGAFDVVEPGEVTRALAAAGQTKPAELDLPGLKKLGEDLKVQAVVFGSVGESTQFRSGNTTTHVISLDARMVDCETGSTIWTANVTSGGPGPLSRLIGVGEDTRGDAVRNTIHRAVKSLIK
jgi:polysaccharide biosynthesis protein PelC